MPIHSTIAQSGAEAGVQSESGVGVLLERVAIASFSASGEAQIMQRVDSAEYQSF